MIRVLFQFQTEDDDLQLALALSLLEMKDHQLSTPSQFLQPEHSSSSHLTSESQPQESSHTQQPADVVEVVGRAKNTYSAPTGPWGKGTTQDTGLQRSADVDKCVPETVTEGDQMMEERDLNQSEKQNRMKNRRQRRKAARQQVVGLPCTPSAPPPVLLWFRRDLRLCDNPALIASLEFGAPVIPVFIWSPEEEEGPGITLAMGGASKFLEEPVIILYNTRHHCF